MHKFFSGHTEYS